MAKLTIIKGLPGVGKSTLARQMVLESGNTVRINRDDIRKMLAQKWSPQNEKTVIDMQKSLAGIAFLNDKNVIIDDTNLRHPKGGPWKDFWALNMSGIETIDLTKESIGLCVQRDRQRKTRENGRVGRAIINRMALENGLIDWDAFDGERSLVENRRIVICDIDGTVADLEHRLHYVNKPGLGFELGVNGEASEKKDYRKFHSECVNDTPFPVVIQWVSSLYSAGYTVCMVSGRSDECAIETEEWLLKHGPCYDFLFMRRSGDYRDDAIIKREILKMLPKERIEFAVDDRPRILNMWRSEGIKVYPVHQDKWEGRE